MNDFIGVLILILFALIIGFGIGTSVDVCGKVETTYCKEIKIDTIRYDLESNLYKFRIEMIK